MPLRTVYGKTVLASYAVAEIIDRLRSENERLEEIEKRYQSLSEIFRDENIPRKEAGELAADLLRKWEG